MIYPHVHLHLLNRIRKSALQALQSSASSQLQYKIITNKVDICLTHRNRKGAVLVDSHARDGRCFRVKRHPRLGKVWPTPLSMVVTSCYGYVHFWAACQSPMLLLCQSRTPFHFSVLITIFAPKAIMPMLSQKCH